MSVNKVILIGNVGKEPVYKETQGGGLASFSLATNKLIKGQESVAWHNCVTFGKIAEIVKRHVHKGSQLYLEGELKYETYEDKNGQMKNITKVLVNVMKMMRGPSNKEEEQSYPSDHNYKNSFDDEVPF